MKRFFLALTLLPAVLAGCARNCYLVEIRPQDEGFQRQLTCWRESGQDRQKANFPAEELARLKNIYPHGEGPDQEGKHRFSRTFTGKPPDDVGGAGACTRLESPLGILWIYVERFRGADDLPDVLARRRQAVDRLVDILIGWCRAEIGRDPRLPALERFLDGDLRKDLHHLTLSVQMAAKAREEKRDLVELLVRVGQYLRERGYLGPDDLPVVARAVALSDATPVLAHVQRLLASKMGVPRGEPIPACLDFLADQQRAAASFKKYAASDDFRRRSGWRPPAAPADKPKDAQAERPDESGDEKEQADGGAFMGHLVGEAFIRLDLGPADELTVELACRRQPFETNGKWEEGEGTAGQAHSGTQAKSGTQAGGGTQPGSGIVRWTAKLDRQIVLPVLCYASWSTPAEAEQKAHFGRVILAGRELASYVLWYRGLTPEERSEWDHRLIARCKPGADLRGLIEGFRFSDEIPARGERKKEDPSDRSAPARELILKAIN